MMEEYIYKASIERAEIIDKTLWSILKTRRPRTYVVLNALQWRWVWKAAGIELRIIFKDINVEEYQVYQFDDLLGTFTVRVNFKAV